jgi:hypothetical protein
LAGPNRKKTLKRCGNLLLVEGTKDLYALAELCEMMGTPWKPEPVYIEDRGGVSTLLAELHTDLEDDQASRIGIIIDADPKFDPQGQEQAEAVHRAAQRAYERLYNRLCTRFPTLPPSLPADGAHSEIHDGTRVGVWVMPDNQLKGFLETFLLTMIDSEDALIAYAGAASRAARRHLGAPFKEAQSDKAQLHTWLAWQDEPGDSPSDAVKFRKLKPSNEAQRFYAWFTRLFDLPTD